MSNNTIENNTHHLNLNRVLSFLNAMLLGMPDGSRKRELLYIKECFLNGTYRYEDYLLEDGDSRSSLPSKVALYVAMALGSHYSM